MDQDLVYAAVQILEIDRRIVINFICLREIHCLAIDRQSLPLINDFVTRQADSTFDVVNARIRWQTENDHIASLWLSGFDDLRLRHGQSQAITEFLDEDKITHDKRRLH